MRKLKEKLDPTIANILYVSYRTCKDMVIRQVLYQAYKRVLQQNREQYFKNYLYSYFTGETVAEYHEQWDKYGNTHLGTLFKELHGMSITIGEYHIHMTVTTTSLRGRHEEQTIYGTIWKPRVTIFGRQDSHRYKRLHQISYTVLKKYLRTLVTASYNGITLQIPNVNPGHYLRNWASCVTVGSLVYDPSVTKVADLGSIVPPTSTVCWIRNY